jgi:hypothetical protein
MPANQRLQRTLVPLVVVQAVPCRMTTGHFQRVLFVAGKKSRGAKALSLYRACR